MLHRELTVNIIGAGKVGRTLARLIHEQRMAAIAQVVCLHPERSVAACDLIGQGVPAEISQVTHADIHFITTRDLDIQHMCETLVAQGSIKPGALVVHCSGVLTSQALDSAKAVGALVCSLHPLKSFSKIKQALKTMQGTSWVIEGDDAAIELLTAWVNAWGGIVRPIRPENKPAYHAACVLAGAGLTTLYDASSQLLASCGFTKEDINLMLPAYLTNILNNNVDLGSRKALTGPVIRNDFATIALHQRAIEDLCPDIQDIYNQILTDSMSLAKRELEPA